MLILLINYANGNQSMSQILSICAEWAHRVAKMFLKEYHEESPKTMFKSCSGVRMCDSMRDRVKNIY